MNPFRTRFAATLPLAGLLAASLLAGCGNGKDDTAVDNPPAPAPGAPAAPAPSGPSGPAAGGAMSGGKMSGGAGQGSGDGQAVGDPVTTAKIKGALIAAKVSGVNVSTAEGGAVSLTGTVATAQQKTLAEQTAKKTPGVKKVMNYLKVGK